MTAIVPWRRAEADEPDPNSNEQWPYGSVVKIIRNFLFLDLKIICMNPFETTVCYFLVTLLQCNVMTLHATNWLACYNHYPEECSESVESLSGKKNTIWSQSLMGRAQIDEVLPTALRWLANINLFLNFFFYIVSLMKREQWIRAIQVSESKHVTDRNADLFFQKVCTHPAAAGRSLLDSVSECLLVSPGYSVVRIVVLRVSKTNLQELDFRFSKIRFFEIRFVSKNIQTVVRSFRAGRGGGLGGLPCSDCCPTWFMSFSPEWSMARVVLNFQNYLAWFLLKRCSSSVMAVWRIFYETWPRPVTRNISYFYFVDHQAGRYTAKCRGAGSTHHKFT